MSTKTKPRPEPAAEGRYEPALPLDALAESPTNPRQTYDEQKLAELTESVRAHGVLQPLLVRQPSTPRGKYEIVLGHRRYRAAKAAGLTTIPASVRELTDLQVVELQTIELLKFEQLDALEEAEHYQRLLDQHGYDVPQLVQAVARSEAYVYGVLKLLQLPTPARQAMQKGELPKTTAQLIARVPSPALREKLAALVLDPQEEDLDELHVGYEIEDAIAASTQDGGPVSFRTAKLLVEQCFMRELKQAPWSLKDAQLVPEAGSCEACPKRTGNNRAEYPDGRADVCTDPECYRAKVRAKEKLDREKAEAKGVHVLDRKEAKKALSGWGGYQDLGDKCRTDPERRTFRQLVGEELKAEIVLAHDREGKAHHLVPEDKARAVLEEKGVIPKGKGGGGNGRGGAGAGADAGADAKWRREREAEAFVRAYFDRAVFEASRARLAVALLSPLEEGAARLCRWMLEGELAELRDDDDWASVAACLGVPSPAGSPHDGRTVGDRSAWEGKAAETLLTDRSAAELLALTVTLIASREYGFRLDLKGERLAGLCRLLDIDPARFKAEAKAALKEKQKAAKAAAKASKNGTPKPSPARADTGTPEPAAPSQRCRRCQRTEPEEGQFWVEAGLCSACCGKDDGYHPLDSLINGPTREQIEAAYVADKWVHPKKDEPIGVKPFILDGIPWVYVGGCGTWYTRIFDVAPLWPVEEFRERYPGFPTRNQPREVGPDATDEDRLQYYTGTVVRVRGRLYAIAPAVKIVCRRKDPPPGHPRPKKTKAAKPTPQGRVAGDPSGWKDLLPDARPLEIGDRVRCTSASASADVGWTGRITGTAKAAGGKLTSVHVIWDKRPGAQQELASDEKPEHLALVQTCAEALRELARGGKCKVCGCTEADCRLCVERTGEPCEWADPAKQDLCTACLPILNAELTDVPGIPKRDVEILARAGVQHVGQAVEAMGHGGYTLSDAALAAGLSGERRYKMLEAAKAWVKDRLGKTSDGDPLPDMTGDLAPEEAPHIDRSHWRTCPIGDLDLHNAASEALLKKHGIRNLGQLADRLATMVPLGVDEVVPGAGAKLTQKLREAIADARADDDAPEPACVRCGESGGQVVDEACLADDETDLVPWPEVPEEIRTSERWPPEAPDEARYLCGRCLDTLCAQQEITIEGKRQKAQRPKGAKAR